MNQRAMVSQLSWLVGQGTVGPGAPEEAGERGEGSEEMKGAMEEQ